MQLIQAKASLEHEVAKPAYLFKYLYTCADALVLALHRLSFICSGVLEAEHNNTVHRIQEFRSHVLLYRNLVTVLVTSSSPAAFFVSKVFLQVSGSTPSMRSCQRIRALIVTVPEVYLELRGRLD